MTIKKIKSNDIFQNCVHSCSTLMYEFHYVLECPALFEDRRNYLGQYYCSHYNILKFKQVYDYTCDNNSVHKMRYFCNFIKVINANVCPPWQLNFDILLNTEQKKERYIKFSLKLRIFNLNIVTECIVIYNHQCFMVDMSCRGDR